MRHLGLALGGRPAQALGQRLLLPVSKDTFLRSLRDTAGKDTSVPRVISIDDWAWRKGQRFGTLICDLERRTVIDLLPDREPATVEAWLRARPWIEVVARDRIGGFGGAVARALPAAVQVARIEAALPALAAARALTDRFTDMVRNAAEGELVAWLDDAADSMIASFARGLRSDYAAVATALREPWSNGQTEGRINRLTALKRQMYGRANTDLLRARLIATS